MACLYTCCFPYYDTCLKTFLQKTGHQPLGQCCRLPLSCQLLRSGHWNLGFGSAPLLPGDDIKSNNFPKKGQQHIIVLFNTNGVY